MDKDKALYNQYQHKIPNYDTFKSMKNKDLKTLLFTGWIAEFGSQEIRKKMGIPYSTYGYLVKTFTHPVNDATAAKMKNIIEVEGYSIPDLDPYQPQLKSTEVSVVEPEAKKDPAQAPQAAKSPFISVEWINTPETLKSQLEAIANVLLYEKGEITVKLEVFKNN